jgi:hypothetical protein
MIVFSVIIAQIIENVRSGSVCKWDVVTKLHLQNLTHGELKIQNNVKTYFTLMSVREVHPTANAHTT